MGDDVVDNSFGGDFLASAGLADAGSWVDSGAGIPSPDSVPSFNSPATQDSMHILDTTPTGIDALTGDLQSIFGKVSSLVSSVQTAAASANQRTQAAALVKQQTQASNKVLLAQSTAAQGFAQTQANIAGGLSSLTASPGVVLLLIAGLAYLIFFRKA